MIFPMARYTFLGFLLSFLLLPSYANACDLQNKAKEYLNDVYNSSGTHYGSSKPVFKYDTKNLRKVGKNKYWVGANDGVTLTIYEKALDKLYGKKCTPAHSKELKATIAHEYAHHIDFNHNQAITKMISTKDLERAAIVGGEHILHKKTWGRIASSAKGLKSAEKKKYTEIKGYIDRL
jgi:hypothetical protein